MKRTYRWILCLIIFASCSKSKDFSETNTYIKYKVNGVTVEYDGDYAKYSSSGEGAWATKAYPAPSPSWPFIHYSITGMKPLNQSQRIDQMINMYIVTDSLKTGIYVPTDSSKKIISGVKSSLRSTYPGYGLLIKLVSTSPASLKGR